MSIKHWDSSLQPREKAYKLGFECLSDSELLAIVLKSGYKGTSSVQLANQLLTKQNGLAGLMNLSLEELMSIKGIKLAKATQILAYLELAKRISWSHCTNDSFINTPDMVIEWLKKSIGLESLEYFVVIFLNNQNKVISYEKYSDGSINEVKVNINEILRKAILKHSNKIVVAHNHPTGNCHPSKNDVEMTNRMIQAATLLNIVIIDHLIITNNDYYSFKQHELI